MNRFFKDLRFAYLCARTDEYESMILSNAAIIVLRQLADVVNQVDDIDFSRPSNALGGSTIGQHVRHALEFFNCLEAGYHTGVINYDKRSHDSVIEKNKEVALGALGDAMRFVSGMEERVNLRLEVNYSADEAQSISIDTNAVRELVYNIEHTVHHMAMVKVAVRDVAPYITLAPDFGMAASTVRHLRSLKTDAIGNLRA